MARRRLQGWEWTAARRLVDAVVTALAPLETALRTGVSVAVPEITALLLEALAGAARDETGSDRRLWHGREGEALATLLTGLAEGGDGLVFPPGDFPAFLDALLAGVAVNRPAGADPRVHIWGTLEARLQSADLLILAGLDEGVWPSETRTDAWLSRAMRAELGLPPPERRIGQAAHDFAEGMGSPRVIASRAEKRGGAPTVASRWLQRLAALLGEEAWKPLLARGQLYLDLARDLDSVAIPHPVRRPRPAPPVEARPKSLSITEIETLVRDPYAIYAKHVLRLEELDPAGRPPDYALRGSLLHQAIGDFTIGWQGAYGPAALARLIEVGRQVLAEIADFPDVHALWSARFAGIARWLVEWEAGRAAEVGARHAEISGKLEMPFAGSVFTLRGRADRIDLRTDGRLDILDYKTGTPPSAKEVLQGFAPQLALEAAMASRGAFGEEFRGRSVATLAWIGLSRSIGASP
jgi:ATP-dependent helicase/nuclease subunit B